MKITVQNRPSYGKDRIYPMDPVSVFIANYGKRATFDPADIDMLGGLGFEVEYLPVEQPNPLPAPPKPKPRTTEG